MVASPKTFSKTTITKGTPTMKKLFLFLIALILTFGIIFNITGCYPVFLSKDQRADAKSEYKTKYFVIKPPQGRWVAVIDTPKFNVPYEGNLLARSMPEIIEFYKIPYVRAIGLKISPDFVITTYPLFDAERFNGDTLIIAEAVKKRKEGSAYKKGGIVSKIVKTVRKFESVIIGNKTFYKLYEVSADDCAPVISWTYYYYFTENRIYEISMLDDYTDLLKTFEPIKYESTKEEALLEKALCLWYLESHSTYLFEYNPEKVTWALQDVINENPDNYIAHLFLGMHHLEPKDFFYTKIVAPKIKQLGNVERVLTEEMWELDHYKFNEIWLVNKKDFYSYLLHGNFDDKTAIAEFEIALKINPDSYTARYFLSWLYLRTGEYEKAVSIYKKQLDQNPQDTDALLMMAVAYKGMGLEKESEEYFNKLKKITHKGTLYDLLDKFLGPGLAQSLGEAIGRAVRIK